MIILNARKDDIKEIVAIVEETKKYFKEKGIPQWQNAYPEEKDFVIDLNKQQLYVIKDLDRVIGTFTILEYDPNYDYIEDGNWLSNMPYIAIHRMTIKDSYRRKGVATFVLNELKKKYNHIRIDTHELNIPMKNLVINNGFKYCGIVYMNDKTKRNAYEYLG